jgi:hypothetical protein
MKNFPLRASGAALAAALALAGCGGGGGSGGNPADTSSASSADYATVLSKLNTTDGLTSSAAANVFDNNYLDSGMTKPQVVDALAGEAAALGSDSEHSLFPQATLENAKLSDCDAKGVCTLTGTLRNNDADDTSVPISIQVVSTGNGGYRLLGDQLAG